MATDFEKLRNYVLEAEEPKYLAPEGQVRLDVISEVLNGSPTNSANNLKNFSLDLSMDQFKQKLEMFVGTAPNFMKLELYDQTGTQKVADLDNANAKLGDYQPRGGMKIYVVDTDPNNTIKQLQDTTDVEKYTMSEEEYNKREGTYRKWKEQSKAANPPAATAAEEMPDFKIGDRCQFVEGERRGTVMYVGPLEGQKGYWVSCTRGILFLLVG